MLTRAGGGEKEAAVMGAIGFGTRDGQIIGGLEHVRQISVEEAVPLKIKLQVLGAGPGRLGDVAWRQQG